MTVATSQPRPRYTVQDYLQIEHDSTERHEYRDGEIVAMAGGTVAHSQIIANCIGELRNRLRDSSCNVFDSNLRVCISRGTLYSYPDATVICGRPELDLDDARGQTVTNPRLVVSLDLSEGLVVGATAYAPHEPERTFDGALALSGLLVLSSGRVRVDPVQQPAATNVMSTGWPGTVSARRS